MTKKIIISVFLIMTFMTSCRYKEGPIISFRSVEKRLIGTWQLTAFTSNGIDSLKYYNDSCGSNAVITNLAQEGGTDLRMFFNFRENNEFGASLPFTDNKNILKVNFGNNTKQIIGPIGHGTSDWEILKLSNKKFKVSTDFNNKSYIISFEKIK